MDFFKVNRARKSMPFTMPAPVGGLNGRDGLADMPAKDAFVLDNWIPNNTTVDTRGGSANWVTGVGAPVESLEVFAGGAASKLLAFGNGSVYDVSLTGALGAAIKSGRVGNKVSSCMFSNAGAQYLMGCTGSDVMFAYDGTTWTDTTITGLTGLATTLTGVFAFKGQRLFLVQKNQLGFYYLGVGAIQGAAAYFDLSQVCRRGGYLIGIASYSAESSGSTPADYVVFMTSEGEYVVYTGTDPSNAATWALVGRYYSSPPIGRKGWFNFRSDLFIICDEGIIAFSEIRTNGESGKDIEYVSAKLGTALAQYMVNNATHGWSGISYPRGNLLIVNVPTAATTAGEYVQFAMNTDTNAWCRFTKWNGLCFAVFNRRLFFGTSDGRIVLADEGNKDLSLDIICDARQAFNYFDDGHGSGDADKHFHFATFIVQADGTPALASSLCVNWEDDQPTLTTTGLDASGAQWDVSSWDVTDWAGSGATQQLTVPYGKIGYVASPWLRASTLGSGLKWFATRVVAEKLNGLILSS